MYYRCLAHIPRTLATVADSYRPVFAVSRSLSSLEKGEIPEDGDSGAGRSAETSLYHGADNERIFH